MSVNIADKANFIWSIADKLTGAYKPHEYGLVILPLTVIRRFDCVLESTKEEVLKVHEKNEADKLNDAAKDLLLRKVSKTEFYNTSRFTFDKLLDDPDNLESNLRNYINGFSFNVREIIEKFKFDAQIETMADKGILYHTMKEFTKPAGNFHPDKVSNIEMGYIFEEIIRRFSESHNEDAGQHYTPREVIELMTNILFINDDIISGDSISRTLYDPACGTGGMLSIAEEHISSFNNSSRLICFGQEINDQTFAICKADRLIKGATNDQIECANTLSDDKFTDMKFDYILSNPPFGREWKNERIAIEKEARLGEKGRFGIGLPDTKDSQMLFLLTAISKMKLTDSRGGRVAIIHNGSPLFIGGAGSGPSEIRRYILENDLLDAIIALPNDLFYNTGIATYIWILDNKKDDLRKGRVQLINASEMYERRKKSLGKKRNDIPKSAIEKITQIYGDFTESEISKIFDNADFGFTKIVVESPLIDENKKLVLTKGKPKADPKKKDTENVPLKEDVGEYFEREVLPFDPLAWINESKSKVGYEIPFTRYFSEYKQPRPSSEIMIEIRQLENEINDLMKEILR